MISSDVRDNKRLAPVILHHVEKCITILHIQEVLLTFAYDLGCASDLLKILVSLKRHKKISK